MLYVHFNAAFQLARDKEEYFSYLIAYVLNMSYQILAE